MDALTRNGAACIGISPGQRLNQSELKKLLQEHTDEVRLPPWAPIVDFHWLYNRLHPGYLFRTVIRTTSWHRENADRDRPRANTDTKRRF